VRITALATVVVAVVLVAMAIVLLVSQRHVLVANLDESLATHNDALAADYARGGLDPHLPAAGDDDAIAQVVGADGTVLAASENFLGRPPLPAPSTTDQARTARLLEGEPKYRVVSHRRADVVIHTAAPLDDLDETQLTQLVTLAVTIPVVTAVLALLVWWLVGRTLRPVEAMRREVAEISGGDLHRRVAEPPTRDEIARLAATMNGMLDRVEASVDRQRRFVADASHELRSPLTRIRSEIEVDLRHPHTADPIATERSVLAETEHLQRIVDDLLLLARHDVTASQPSRSSRLVDLDDIVLQEVHRLRSTNGVRVDVRGVSAAQVRGDADGLTRVVRNLVENACRYARDSVVVTLAETAGQAVLTVVDDGPGIPPRDRERIFERFTRLDEARTGADAGTGLGLAIAREVVERHRGSIRADAAPVGGARFVVELPLAEPTPATSDAGAS
jgi:signal transduction histidine kinase